MSLVTGCLLLLGGLLLYGLGKFDTVTIGSYKLCGVIMIFGIGLIVGGACEVFIKPSRQMQIEARDERNVVIGKTAKALGFDIMTLLLSVTMTIMVLLNVISTGAFFVLFGVYVISQIVFIARLWYLQKNM